MKNTLITSIVLMVVGCLLFIVGSLFRIMHWPDMYKGFYSGPAIFIAGASLFIIYLIRKNKGA
ncbi:MAG: hypothetical protein ACXVC6_11760 [Bacteroidia bacterium]